MNEFAGRLRERIVIEKPSEVRTTTGLRSEGWEPLTSCWGAIEQDGVGRDAIATAMSAMPRFRVTVRARDDLSIGQRVRWGKRILAMRQLLANPLQPDRIVLRCEEERA
jgi:head-tail adaptor